MIDYLRMIFDEFWFVFDCGGFVAAFAMKPLNLGLL